MGVKEARVNVSSQKLRPYDTVAPQPYPFPTCNERVIGERAGAAAAPLRGGRRSDGRLRRGGVALLLPLGRRDRGDLSGSAIGNKSSPQGREPASRRGKARKRGKREGNKSSLWKRLGGSGRGTRAQTIAHFSFPGRCPMSTVEFIILVGFVAAFALALVLLVFIGQGAMRLHRRHAPPALRWGLVGALRSSGCYRSRTIFGCSPRSRVGTPASPRCR